MYDRGDGVRSLDPFKLDEDAERYWLIANDDRHPFAYEQFIAISLTTTPHDPATEIPDEAWADGGLPQTSYVLSWAIHSPRIEEITERVGRLTEAFYETVLVDRRQYFTPK